MQSEEQQAHEVLAMRQPGATLYLLSDLVADPLGKSHRALEITDCDLTQHWKRDESIRYGTNGTVNRFDELRHLFGTLGQVQQRQEYLSPLGIGAPLTDERALFSKGQPCDVFSGKMLLKRTVQESQFLWALLDKEAERVFSKIDKTVRLPACFSPA